MGVPGSANLMLFGGAQAYEIDQSLRFNSADSTNLSRTPSSSGNRRTYTISCWVKRAQIGATQKIWSAGPSTLQNFYLYFTSTDELQLSINNETAGILKTTAKYRDASAWYHILIAVDTTQSTASDRIKFYVNGEAVTAFASASYPSQNLDTQWNHTEGHRIGVRNNDLTFYINAYIAEFNNISGSALTPSSFGETDPDTGAWIPKRYTGTYTGNSFYLKFESSGIGTDSSGLSNTWTANNFTTSGTGTDVMSDTPTTNWCTLNPLQQSNDTTLSDGNLRFAGSVSKGMICGTQGATSGKYYWEFIVNDSGQDMSVGITNLDKTVLNLGSGGSVPGRNTWSWGLYMYPLNTYIKKVHNTVYTDTSATKVSNGDVIGIAYDAGAGKMWASKNNTWMDSGDPAAGTNALFTNLSGTLAPAVNPPGGGVSTTNTANFGQRAFAYTPPTGYKALNTQNLPEPTIKDGSDYFQTVLYQGNHPTGQNIIVADNSGNSWQPDFIWIKIRNAAYYHRLYDSIRGATKQLYSNATDSEFTNVNALTSFNSNGFTLGSDTGVNQNGSNFVSWNWKAGGTGSSNNAGTITSTVSANASAGFSIVTWTGTGADGSYGHGLGVKPAMIIHKRRDSTSDWHVWHQGLPTKSPTNDVIYLNLTNAQNGGNSNLFRLDPTSSVIYTGSAGSHNVNGATYVDYVWSEVAGYSKFGSYTGNGSSDGPAIWCGFRPAWVLIKRTGGADDWFMYDTTRDTYNEAYRAIDANTSDIEKTSNTIPIDILSNGFKIRSSGTAMNGSGETIIFAAFAELPFKYSTAR